MVRPEQPSTFEQSFEQCAATGNPTCAQGLGLEECLTLRARIVRLVRTRWLIVALSLVALGLGALLFPGWARWWALALVVMGLGVANLVWYRWLTRQTIRRCSGAIGFAVWQIAVDFLLLAVAVHLTSGIRSPLAPLFVVHGIFSAILLPRRFALGVGGLTGLLVAGSIGLTSLGLPESVWRFDAPAATPCWVGELLRFGLLVVALGGATAQGFALHQEIRRRHKKIAELAATLAERNGQLQRVDEQRLRLLAVASHDLRSPLAAIESYLNLFLSDIVPGSTEQHKVYFRRMKERIGQLRGFINDLLDLTAMESRPPEQLQPLDLTAQLREVLRDQEQVAREAGLTLESTLPTVPVRILASGRLQLVWANLISNAIKYGAGRSPVRVELRQEGDRVLLTVADRGLGISPEDQAHLFEDFYRAPAVKKAGLPGTGLGLAISRRVLEGLGGSITVQSQLGEGTTFTVTLPAAREGG